MGGDGTVGTEKTCYQFHLRDDDARRDALEPKRDSDNQVKRAAGVIESWKVILGVIFGMIAMIVAGTIYVQSFATTEAVASSMDRHEASDGHPSLSGGIRGISDRLLRVEITQAGMVKTQESMDQKLDRILNVIPLVRVPTYQPAQPTP